MSVNQEPCRRLRRDLTLLAAGILAEPEAAAVQTHLASCAACRSVHQQLARVTRGLQELGRPQPGLEPSAEARQRWARTLAAPPTPRRAELLADALREWWCRAWAGPRPAFAGLAAVWLLALFFRLAAPEVGSAATDATASAPVVTREFLLALRSRELWPGDPDLERPPVPETSAPMIPPTPSGERPATPRSPGTSLNRPASGARA